MTEGKKPENKLAIDLANAPKLMLSGIEFPIAILSWKENRIVEPLIRKVLPVYYQFLKLAGERATIGQGADPKSIDPTVAEKFISDLAAMELPEWVIDALATIVYVGITRGTPGFGRPEFDGLQIGLNDLFEGMTVVMMQTGLYRQGKKEIDKTGEAQGEAPVTA